MADQKWAPWVPTEVITCWEIFIAGKMGEMLSRSFEDVDIKNFAPEDRSNIQMHIETAKRYRQLLEVGPRLLQKFENGPEPKKLWDSISGHQNYTPWLFICAVRDAYAGVLTRFDFMTPKERERWPEKVSESAYKLRELIQGSPLENLLNSEFFRVRDRVLRALELYEVSVSEDLRSAITHEFMNPPLQSTLLYKIAENPNQECPDVVQLEIGQSLPTFYSNMSRPNDKEAHRAYFIRYMTHFFQKMHGAPERGLVKILVRALFDQDLDTRQLADIAPVINEG